jgi:heme exporter protein C
VPKLFALTIILVAAMFAYAPVLIVNAPTESTMGLVQKIFYFHVPSWFAMFTAVTACGLASLVVLVRGRKDADRLALAAAEIAVVFGLIGLITGPLWGRKAWGVYWQWDAKLTTALVMWLIFVAYLLLRRFAGAGSEKLAATVALFGMANVPFVYWSVHIWRTIHPSTSVVPTLPPIMRGTFWWCVVAFQGVFALMLFARLRLEKRRAELDELYLSLED